MSGPNLHDHLSALYPAWTPGTLLTYVKEPFIRRFGYASGLPKFADHVRSLDEAGYDVYLTINSLDGKAIQSRGPHARGKETEVVSVLAMMADVDAAGKEGHRYPPQPRILQTLDDMPLPPSIVVVSGRDLGGVHAYWLLGDPFIVRNEDDRRRIKGISVAWQKLLKSKIHPFEMDSTFDLVRVLRPIGTANHKYGSVVSAIVFEPGRRYRPDEFEAVIPKPKPRPIRPLPVHLDTKSAAGRARQYLAKVPGAVSKQGGHDVTFHVACILVLGFGLSVEQAMPLLAEWNQTCSPPWSEQDLLHKLDSANARDERRGYMLADTPRKYGGVSRGR